MEERMKTILSNYPEFEQYLAVTYPEWFKKGEGKYGQLKEEFLQDAVNEADFFDIEGKKKSKKMPKTKDVRVATKHGLILCRRCRLWHEKPKNEEPQYSCTHVPVEKIVAAVEKIEEEVKQDEPILESKVNFWQIVARYAKRGLAMNAGKTIHPIREVVKFQEGEESLEWAWVAEEGRNVFRFTTDMEKVMEKQLEELLELTKETLLPNREKMRSIFNASCSYPIMDTDDMRVDIVLDKTTMLVVEFTLREENFLLRAFHRLEVHPEVDAQPKQQEGAKQKHRKSKKNKNKKKF
ncbi:unnamed protein product [Caenorhabditis nigoni]